jgi:hypothetical protein
MPPSDTSSTTIAPLTTVTGPMGVTVPTTIVTYPNPYESNYDSVASLVHDATFIVIASVGTYNADTGYPLDVQNVLGFNSPRIPLAISLQEFDAASLQAGSDYVFFYGTDSIDRSTCIVGGVRGVLAYDPSTQEVTTLPTAPTSQISSSQTVSQLQNEINAEEQSESTQPVSNGPPVCAASATGL